MVKMPTKSFQFNWFSKFELCRINFGFSYFTWKLGALCNVLYYLHRTLQPDLDRTEIATEKKVYTEVLKKVHTKEFYFFFYFEVYRIAENAVMTLKFIFLNRTNSILFNPYSGSTLNLKYFLYIKLCELFQ